MKIFFRLEIQNCFYARHAFTEEPFKKKIKIHQPSKQNELCWSSNLLLWDTQALSSPLPLGFEPPKRALCTTWPAVRQLTAQSTGQIVIYGLW